MISVFRSGRVPQPRAIDPIHLHVRDYRRHAASGRYSWWQEDDHELHHDADPEVAGDSLPRKVGGEGS